MPSSPPAPELTVAVAVVGDESTLAHCLRALVPQIDGKPVEVVLPYDSALPGIGDLLRLYPQVRFVDLGPARTRAPLGTVAACHELFDRRASEGLKAARGQVIALLQDWGAPAPDWCDRLLEAHRQLPHAAIGGAVENTRDTVLNWAVYLLDFGRYQLPLPEGPAGYLTDVNLSYKREALEPLRSTWHESYNEVSVNWALLRSGHTLWQTPRIVVHQDRGPLRLRPLLAERFGWGRIFGAARAPWVSAILRPVYVLGVPLLPPVLAARPGLRALRTGRGFGTWLRCLPAMLLLSTFWCWGEAWGLATGRAHAFDRGTPA